MALEQYGILELVLDFAGEPPPKLRASIDTIRLVTTDGAEVTVSAGSRPIAARDAAPVRRLFALAAPIGKYRAVTCDVADRRLTAAVDVVIEPRSAVRLEGVLDLGRLDDPKPDAALRVAVAATRREPVPVATPSGERSFTAEVGLGLGRSRRAALVVPRDVLGPDVRITFTPTDAHGLPALFRHQRFVGPVVRILSSEVPHGAMTITVPYDEAEVRAAGTTPERLVILQLDEARRAYRELPPARIDTTAGTLTARIDRFSFFIAGTPGLRFDAPELQRTRRDEVVAFSAAGSITVTGQADDERAVVTCAEAFPAQWDPKLGIHVT